MCRVDDMPAVVHRCQAKWWGRGDDKVDQLLPGEDIAVSMRPERLMGAEHAQEVFTRVYKSGHWGYGELSGGGSEPGEAAPYVAIVKALAQVGGWTAAVDLCCGDGRVARASRRW